MTKLLFKKYDKLTFGRYASIKNFSHIVQVKNICFTIYNDIINNTPAFKSWYLSI